jgi:hypothetical protein
VLFRHAAQRPQCILQTFGERHEALAAEHHMGMRKARGGEPEVIEAVQERHARDGDAKTVHVGEVRQAHPSRRIWRNITSRLGPLSARQFAMRRSNVRRPPSGHPAPAPFSP